MITRDEDGSGAKAKDILSYYYGITFPNTISRSVAKGSYLLAKEEVRTVKAYPNPTSGTFSISDIHPFVGMDLHIANVFGEIVYSRKISDHRQIIDSDDLKNGLYIITVLTDNKVVATGKIIILK